MTSESTPICVNINKTTDLQVKMSKPAKRM